MATDSRPTDYNELLRTRVLLTPGEAAGIYSCSVEAIYKRVREGELPAHRVGERRLGIPAAAIREDLGIPA